jgi:hypothetical protein
LGARGACRARGAHRTDTTLTTSTSIVYDLQKKGKQTILVYTGVLHFLDNFFT